MSVTSKSEAGVAKAHAALTLESEYVETFFVRVTKFVAGNARVCLLRRGDKVCLSEWRRAVALATLFVH